LYAGFQGWKMVQVHHVGVNMHSVEKVPVQDSVRDNANEIFTDSTENPHELK